MHESKGLVSRLAHQNHLHTRLTDIGDGKVIIVERKKTLKFQKTQNFEKKTKIFKHENWNYQHVPYSRSCLYALALLSPLVDWELSARVYRFALAQSHLGQLSPNVLGESVQLAFGFKKGFNFLIDYSVRHKKSLISKRLQFFDYFVRHKKSLISIDFSVRQGRMGA